LEFDINKQEIIPEIKARIMAGNTRLQPDDYTPEILEKISDLSGCGLSLPLIGSFLCISRSTFISHRNKNPAIMEAYLRGKAKTIVSVAGHLFRKIKEGDTAAIIFYLKTQGRWRTADYDKTIDIDETENCDTIESISNDPNEAIKTYQLIINNEKS
jgi:hypothetical protein